MAVLSLYDPRQGIEQLGHAWTLQKGSLTAICTVTTHPLGWELLARIDNDLVRSEVCRAEIVVFDTSDAWRHTWETMGWRTRVSSQWEAAYQR